ncbi:hypothetical protein COU80_03260 [Candidatus Peregrinibacteria bacterium CG10_big_fil_rev_8_21_14_0_10_55_24]|nr:MAG: hypothetical protein COU80_03260 [Candidatus Peregrinibacteria bacterium CG10_big_fil_rev_8_21_14_0_10_55_24]
MNRIEQTARGLLEIADVQVGGERQQDIHVHHPDLYRRVLAEGSLGLGESAFRLAFDEVDVIHSRTL